MYARPPPWKIYQKFLREESNMETLTSLAIKAQKGDNEAMVYLYEQFQPLLLKESTRDGELDLDCYQELSEYFVRLIMDFEEY